MLRMIIVDDESIVRETIRNIIDWKAHDVELLCACKDGIEAYNEILDEYPDLVLMDINIPGINGLDLIQKIRAIDDSISFIIISGYECFEYAKRALQYGVSEYLLKPCSKQEILTAVESVKKKRAEAAAICEMQRMNLLLKNEVRSAIQMQFLSDVFSRAANVESLIASYADAISCEANGYASLYLVHHQVQLPPDCVDTIADALLNYELPHYFHILSAHNIAVMTVAVNSFEQFEQLRLTLEQALALQLQDFTISVSHYPNMQSLLSSLIPELKMVGQVEQVWKNGLRRILFAPELRASQNDPLCEKDGKDYLQLSQAELERDVARRFHAVYNVESAKTLATHIIYQLLPHLAAYQKNAVTAAMNQIYSSTSITDIQLQLNECILGLCAFHEQACDSHDFTHKIQQYVEENLSNPNLSLKWIAENILYMNVNYVSKQFFKRTGVKFSAYLTNTRLKRALSLMNENPQIKISELADCVGLGDNPQYFSQIFKKHTGCSPSQYIAQLES